MRIPNLFNGSQQ